MNSLGDKFSDIQARHPGRFIAVFYPWCGRDPYILSVVDTVEEAFRLMRDITNRDKGVPFLIFPPDVLRRT